MDVFKRKYEKCIINKEIENLYAISSVDSLISSDQYIDFLDDLNLDYKIKNLNQIKNVDVTVKAKEELFDSSDLYYLSHDKLFGNGINVKLQKKSEI